MAARTVLAVLATSALLTGCGSAESGDAAAPPPVAAAAGPTGTASPITSPTAKPAPARAAGASSAASVAPEVVVPTTSDPVVQARAGGWQGAVLAGLRQLDPRLVADESATIRRVRSACDAFSAGLFQAKAVELVRTKFSTRTLMLTEDQAELVYQVLLREACYPMGGEDTA